MKATIIDAGGKPLHVGLRVRTTAASSPGTIIGITEVEGDVDSEGRTVPVYPRILVEWDDFLGDPDRFVTSPIASDHYYIPTFQCDDLEAAEEISIFFAYGIFIEAANVRHLGIEGESFVSTARLPGWRLEFRGPCDIDKVDSESYVPGVLWEIPDAAWDRLDGVEGAYDRRVVTVQTDSGEKRAYAYSMRTKWQRCGGMSGYMESRYADLGFDLQILHDAEARAAEAQYEYRMEATFD